MQDPPVVIDGENIKVLERANLSGLTISNDLTWNTHISEAIKKASKRLYFSHPAEKGQCVRD